MGKRPRFPDAAGHFGPYGGRFVPETLMAPLAELVAAYDRARRDRKFRRRLSDLLRTFAGRPTALWVLPYPTILEGSVGVRTEGFGFTISWATNASVVVEACTNLANPTWTPVGTNLLTDGWSYFSDPHRTNYPVRFYRVRWP